MKTYTAKTLEDAIKAAVDELGVPEEELAYEVAEEKKGLFSKKVVINVYELSDAIEFMEKYLKDVITALGIDEVEVSTTLQDDIIRVKIDTSHNPVLIGKNGVTLQALNEITRLAVSTKFKRRFRILLDVGDYKDAKYRRVAAIGRRVAKEVQKTKVDVTLEAMPSDERRIVHNALANFSHIKTESEGEGSHRAVVVKYTDEE